MINQSVPRLALRLAVVVWLYVDALDLCTAQTGRSTAHRKHADGPLIAADFSGQAPPKTPVNFGIEMVANTECAVRYEYRSVVEPLGRDRWVARITRFNCFAVLLPDKCWHIQALSSRILDHEQGHFDLAEIAARRTQRHFEQRISEGKATASGRDRPAAERRLDAEIKQAMEEVYSGLAKDQKTYDEETRHGTAFRAQRRHRLWQKSALESPAVLIGDANAHTKKHHPPAP